MTVWAPRLFRYLRRRDRKEYKLSYVKGTREELRYILFTFYTEITLCKLLCEPKDRAAT